MPTSATDPVAARQRVFARLATEPFDVLVIGGGITGAGIARDAVLRGMRVALVERNDFASGTSSRSSRLVHGGVRYLEHGHLHLVFESSRERRTLLRLAPHLVRPLKFIWPVYRGARLTRWKLNAGLSLYDALALYRNVARHRRLSARAVTAAEPALTQHGLLGGAAYFDAVTDDARLTLLNVLAATEAGAVVVNHCEARSISHQPGAARSFVGVVDALTGRELRADAHVVVNAAGPWSDDVRRLAEPVEVPSLRGSKGVHLAVPRARLDNRGALTLLSPLDGRVMFVLPNGPQAIVGTTDTPTSASPDDVRASTEDIDYLLRSVNAFFPDAMLTAADVISAWAGIRPLVAGGVTRDVTSATREHAIGAGPSGMISVTGGKLTTYRAMSAEVVDEVERALGKRHRVARTARLPLPGGDLASCDEAVAEATTVTRDAECATHLVQAYGSRWRAVWSLVERTPALAGPIAAELPYTMAEVAHAVTRELAQTIGDVLLRRTHVAFETRDFGASVASRVAAVMASLLAWDKERVSAEMERYKGEVARVFGGKQEA